MIEKLTIQKGNQNEQNKQESSRGDYNQSTYYTTYSMLSCIIVQPSRERLTAVKKFYDLVFKVLFFTIAVVALFVGSLVHAVSDNSR